MALKKLPSLSNVGAGQTATLKLPTGPTYEKLAFVYAGVTLAQMIDIRFKINGKEVVYFASGADLDAFNQYYGRPAADGILEMYFRRPELESLEAQDFPSLGTRDVATAELEMKVAAAASAPAIDAYAVQRASENLGIFTKIKRFSYSSATAGEVEIDNIPRGPRIGAIHLMSEDVAHAEVEADSVRIFEADKSLVQRLQSDEGRVPDDGFLSIDFLGQNNLNDALVTAGLQDFRLRLELDNAGAVPFYVEYVDDFSGI